MNFFFSSGICCERNTDALPARRPAPGRSNCVILKLFIQDLRVCESIENIDKIFVLRSFFSSSPRPLFHSSFSHFARRVPSIRENGTDDPSFRANRRVSIVERSTRHASSRDACDVNEGRFYYFVPLFVANPLSRIIDVLISLKFFFFLLINMLCLAYRVIKVSRKFIPPFFKNTLSPRSPVPSFACSCLSFSYFLSLRSLTYLRISGTRVR